ncbi:MAG: hypothetical protein ACNYNY_02650 [Candidatus Oxydemutatoraceae bacterium WSBS_2016_MAG_OTU14]
MPRLDGVSLNNPTATEDSITLTWTGVTNAQTYKVNLYPGRGTSAQVESSMVVTATKPPHSAILNLARPIR